MRLTCKYGSGYVGETTNGQEVILYHWHNSWLLLKHIHYIKYHPEAFEETIKMEIDIDNVTETL